MNRRNMIKQLALLTTLAGDMHNASAAYGGNKMLNIGACDWSLGKGSDPAAFDIAAQIGLKGIMVDMGSAESKLHLRDKAVQQQYLEAARNSGVKISSIAMSVLNNVPYKSAPETEQWVWDSVKVAKNLGVTVVLLAFFNNNDLRNDAAGKKEVISRLKKVAPHAEKNGVTLEAV